MAREKTVESIKARPRLACGRDLDHADEIKAKLEAAPVNVQVRAGDSGRLFGAVTAADDRRGHRGRRRRGVDKRTIVIANPIKSLGAHQVTVKLHDEVSATVALNVVPA